MIPILLFFGLCFFGLGDCDDSQISIQDEKIPIWLIVDTYNQYSEDFEISVMVYWDNYTKNNSEPIFIGSDYTPNRSIRTYGMDRINQVYVMVNQENLQSKYRIENVEVISYDSDSYDVEKFDLNEYGKLDDVYSMIPRNPEDSFMASVRIHYELNPFYYETKWILDGDESCYALITFSDGTQKIYKDDLPDLGKNTINVVLNQSFKNEVCDSVELTQQSNDSVKRES
jgi:hypothetical protein